jgi:hypothetical protein
MSPRPFVALVCLMLGAAASGCHREPSDGAAPSAAASAEPPNVVIEPLRHEFGKVLEGEELSHVFVVKNTGGQPLEISAVRPSCGCTAAVLADKVVPPGGSTQIEVKFRTQGRLGKNNKTVSVITNDPDSGTLQLGFSADVEAIVALDPRSVRLSAQHGEFPTAEAWITGRLAAKAQLKLDPATAKGIAITPIERKRGDTTEHGFRVSLTATAIGAENGVAKFATGLAELPSLELPYSYVIRGNLTVPQQVYIDPDRPTLAQRTIQVRSTRPDFRLIGAQTSGGPFSATVLGPNAKGAVEVRIAATPAATTRKGPIAGQLWLLSNDPLEPRKGVKLSLAAPRPPAAASSGRGGPGLPTPPVPRPAPATSAP